jgi:hypothetical protein
VGVLGISGRADRGSAARHLLRRFGDRSGGVADTHRRRRAANPYIEVYTQRPHGSEGESYSQADGGRGSSMSEAHRGSTSTGPSTHRLRTGLLALGGTIAFLLVIFLIWALTPYRADDVALEAMRSGGGITVVTTGEGIVFSPDDAPETGLVLYPGGRVEAAAYAPLARLIAGEGYLVVVQPMPLNLAVFGIGRAERAFDAFPAIDTWVVGGHSLGGSMAAEFAARRSERVSGLLFLASYPASSTDLSTTELSVLSVRGANDGLVTEADVEDAQVRLPSPSKVFVIDGGNHAGFGSYGEQSGDGPSTLPDGAQALITAGVVAELLATVSE